MSGSDRMVAAPHASITIPELERGDDPRDPVARRRTGSGRLSASRRPDHEFLAGWLLSGIVDWETGTWTMPRTAEEADRLDGQQDGRRDAELAGRRANGWPRPTACSSSSRCIPVGTVDPGLCRFLALVAQVLQQLAQPPTPATRRLAAKLRESGVPFIDLRDDLAGVAGTYRLTDGHWTERGTEIVAGPRVARAPEDARQLAFLCRPSGRRIWCAPRKQDSQ